MKVIGISMSADRLRARVAPLTFLGDDFEKYRTACTQSGATYNRITRDNTIGVDRIEALCSALRRAGFEPQLNAAVIVAMTNAKIERDIERDKANERAAAVHATLSAAGGELYRYQAQGIPWLAVQTAAGLFDKMGLGKTIQALIAAPASCAMLVVCPKNAKYVWLRECAKWRPDLRPIVLQGRGSFRWPERGELVIINYDILPDIADMEVLRGAPSECVLVADEAHKAKNAKSLRTLRLRALSRGVRAASGRTWLLTGTPLQSHPPDLWAVLEVADLARPAFGSYSQFETLMGGVKVLKPTKQCRGRHRGWNATCSSCRRVTEWTGRIDASVPDRLRRVSLMRRREDVLPDLPKKTYETMQFECVDADLRQLCDEVLAAIRKAVGVSLEEAIEEAIATKKGVAFEQMSRVRSRLATAKIPLLMDFVESFEEAEEPLIVFSRHRAPIDALATRPGWGQVTGSQSAEQRRDVEEAFQAGRLKGVCATIQAGCEALTLTRSARVAFVDLDWTPALNQQAEDRACRIGQTRGVIVTRIVADHDLDWHVMQVLAKKQATITAAVDASAVSQPIVGDTR